MKNIEDFGEISAIDLLKEQYKESENKQEIDYWMALSKIVIESMTIRNQKELSQSDLARIMKTKQSVISRFENMGRRPNYDFISRLAIALGHPLGMTLYGDYMAVVPEEKQTVVKELAEKENLSTYEFIQELLEKAVESISIPYVEVQSLDKDPEVLISGSVSQDVSSTLNSYPVILEEPSIEDRLIA